MGNSISGLGVGERRLNGIQTTDREYRNLSEPQHQMEQVDDVAIQLRDAVTLLADVYRPRAEGRYPALLSFSAVPGRSRTSACRWGWWRPGRATSSCRAATFT